MNNSVKWALVLGGSSGLGLATARKLGSHGFNLLVVHRDKRSDLEEINSHFNKIRSSGVKLHAFNMDAVNAAKRMELVEEINRIVLKEKISVLIHSIAKGNVKPMIEDGAGELSGQDFQITIDAMAISLYDWVKSVAKANLFSEDSRVMAFTSEGNTKAWKNYGAIAAAKTALEAIMRNIALEFAHVGVKANCIQAGVTDTKALRMIPNSASLKAQALKRNPHNRLTTPEDVANVAYLLTTGEARWITGTIIKVDGGESLQ